MMLTKEEVLSALRNVEQLPEYRGWQKCRTIYEWGDSKGRGTGRFGLDFAAYPGGTAEEVPRSVINELEHEGIIERAFPNAPSVNGWKLAPPREKEE